MTEALGLAVFVFIAFKTFFGVLGWYSRDGKDELYRKNLDKVWDRLYAGSLFDLGHFFLQRLVTRIRQTIGTKWYGIRIVAFCSFFWNGQIVFLAPILMPQNLQPPLDALSLSDTAAFPVEGLLAVVCISIAGIPSDVISSMVTWKRLKSAAKSISTRSLVKHVVVDAYLALFLAAMTIPLAGIVMGIFLGEVPPYFGIGNINAGPVLDRYTMFTLRLIAFSALLPTLLYALFGASVLALRLIPDFVTRIIRKSVYLITTDDSPVLSQLGNIFGGVAALLAALVKLLS